MKVIRKLILDKVLEGKSLRKIAKESGVKYHNIQKYNDSDDVEPRSEILKKLATYFNVPWFCLIEEWDDYQQLYALQSCSEHVREMNRLLCSLPEEQQSKVLDLVKSIVAVKQ